MLPRLAAYLGDPSLYRIPLTKYLVRLDRHSMCVLPGKSMIWHPVGSSLKQISSHVQLCSTSLYRNRPTDNCSIASCIAGSTSCIAVTFSWMPESSSWTVVMFPAMSGSISWIPVISFMIPGSAPIIVVTLRVVSRIAGSSLETSSTHILTVTRSRWTVCNSALD